MRHTKTDLCWGESEVNSGRIAVAKAAALGIAGTDPKAIEFVEAAFEVKQAWAGYLDGKDESLDCLSAALHRLEKATFEKRPASLSLEIISCPFDNIADEIADYRMYYHLAFNNEGMEFGHVGRTVGDMCDDASETVGELVHGILSRAQDVLHQWAESRANKNCETTGLTHCDRPELDGSSEVEKFIAELANQSD
ncbi:MAG: hypothetical protein AB7I37_25950 [Pirellulales bacterium]